MFKNFTQEDFSELRKQHNIFILVGNGFDISIVKHLKSNKLKGKTTSYMDFYEYIKYFNLCDDNNILYKQMSKDKDDGKENWSDFEMTIEYLLKKSTNIKQLEASINEFQMNFTRFLNDLIDSDMLFKLNEEVKEKQLSIQSLSQFMKDLDNIDEFEFKENLGHYDLYNFVFANFNYTQLLDNYIFLDKLQFDPHKYKYADRNFSMIIPSSYYSPSIYSSYVMSDIIHPHGVQNIPRSILFGIDLEDYDKGKSVEKRFVKGYWSQYDEKYKSYLKEANLFIIYGMSLGLTDSWWMDGIYDQILKRNVELIIYKFGKEER